MQHNTNYIIVIDTETTGLFPRNINPEQYELYNNARMVEIAWELYNSDGLFINKESYIIKPQNYIIPDSAIAIHGITNELAHSSGRDITSVFDRLELILKDVGTIVAHNFAFDNAIILSELYRQNFMSDGLNKYNDLIHEWIHKTHSCTMRMSAYITGTYKWHKLIDLYRICFNKEPNQILHRAAGDVQICADIYFYLINR
jgi:DNA polymerase-3 subunit epsilon